MKYSPLFKTIFIFLILFTGIQMNVRAVAYSCPDPYYYYCADDPVVILHNLGSLPEGGTFTLNQQTVTQIDPAGYPQGAVLAIHYFWRSVTGGSMTCDFQIVIYALPQVSCPKLLAFCWSQNTINIDNSDTFTPNGGTFSGDHITSNGTFDNWNAGPGSHVVTYTYTNPQTGCSNSCQTTINIVNGSIENCPTNGIHVCYNEAIDLAGVANIKPAGGVYSGDYVTNNMLYAPTAGSYDIIYKYTPIQGCPGICKFTITLYPLPGYNCPGDMLICGLDGGPVILPYPRDYGWSYEGDGVSKSPASGIPSFDPQIAGAGKHKITLTIFNDYKCEKVCVFYITVSTISVSCPELLKVCANEKTDLTKLWNFDPKGTFSGDFVDADGIFSAPTVYEQKCSTIKYVLQDEFGCKDSCEFRVCIVPYPRIECPDTVEVCINDTSLLLFPNYKGHFFWNDKEITDPSKLGAGSYDITYNYAYSENPNCEFTCKFVLVIHPEPKLVCPKDTAVCLSDGLFNLPVPGFPHWTYTGAGVYLHDGKPVCDPGKAQPGKHIIDLSVTDKFGCTASCEFTITVVDFKVTCPQDIWICAGEKADLKKKWNFDPRGKFSGYYVSSDGIFEAPMINENKCFDIKYFSTNELGCKDSCIFKVCVFAAPKFECPDTVYLCINGGVYLPKLDYKFNFYWNNKEIPNGFYPATAGVGTHHVKLVYTANNDLKCSYTCEFVIVVVPLPKWECPKDMSLCSADQIITLPAPPFPNYHYSGTGVFTQGGPYYFSAPKPGKYSIIAWYTDKYGCSDSCSFYITVGEFKLDCPKMMKVCPDIKNDLTLLWNFDPRGEFFGEWTTSTGIFNAPYIPGKNNCYTIKYRLKIDENCKDSCRFVVCVFPVPEVKCPDTMEVCITDRPFNPAPAGTNATVYFNGKPIPNGFNPAEAGAGTHILTFEFRNSNSDCKSYCQMVVIVHPLPEIHCPGDIYLCNPEIDFTLPPLDSSYVVKGRGIFFKDGKAHFRAPNGRPGSYTIWLYVKDKFGCSNSCSFQIIVGNLDVSCPEVLYVCPDAITDLTTLWKFNPHGTFTGPFIDASGHFDAPEVTGNTECFPILYVLKSEDGCSDSCLFKVCVKPLPQIKCPDTIHKCINDNLFDPMPGAPGTIYFNDRPIPNGFNPQEVGVGTYNLTYIYRYGEKPVCEYACKFVIVVHPLPEIECPNNMLICSSDQKFELPKQSYSNYVYSGDGITYESGHYYFNSAVAGGGSHVIMLVVYNEWGCKSVCRFTILVGKTKIECPDTLWICAGTKGDLNRLWNFPYDGTFSGTGITPEGIYYADEIKEKQSVDVYYYYYKYKCKDSCLFTVCVDPLPKIECPDTIHTCINGNSFVPIENASGIFYLNGRALPNGVFNPVVWGEGIYHLTYVQPYGHNQKCEFTCSFVIVVHNLPKFECPQDILVCDLTIKTVLLPVMPYPFFEYTGDFVEGASGSQIFNVSAAGTGIHLISVTVKDKWGCYKTCRFRVIVGEGTILCPDTLYLCPGEKYPVSRLASFPGGGHFISSMVSDNWFSAPVTDVDKCYNIKYVLKDKYGCIDSCNFVICVQGRTILNCPDTISVCEDGEPFVPEITPTGGTFKTADGALLAGGLFDPAVHGPGNYTIYYRYVSAAPYFCEYTCSFVIQVMPKPELRCPYTRVLLMCVGDDPIDMGGLTWPYGGTYTSVDGEIITVFDPKEPGLFQFVYTFTDPHTGCSSTCEMAFYVNKRPVVTCPKDTAICAKKGVYELRGGKPEGGIYQEHGNTVSYINTDVPGEHTICYIVTDRYTGCADSCCFNVYILPQPKIDCPEKITICSKDKLNLLDWVTKPAYKMYDYWFTGPGLSGAHNEIFEAFGIHSGEYLINYFVKVGDCIDSCSFWINVVTPPTELKCINDTVVCAHSSMFSISRLFSPTGAPIDIKVLGNYITYNLPDGSWTFDPQSVQPSSYNKPIEIKVSSCTRYNKNDSCCSTCIFHITVTNGTTVGARAHAYACEGTSSIDLNDYVNPVGGKFYHEDLLLNHNFSLSGYKAGDEYYINYFYPMKGVPCATSITFLVTILPAPTVTLRDTIWPDKEPLVITNNQVTHATAYKWYSDGTGYFDDPLILHPTYHSGVSDIEKGKVYLHLLATNEKCDANGTMVARPAQQLQFPAGWSGVSIYRDPLENNLEKIVEPIRKDLNKIYSPNGDEYVPLKNILTTWDIQSGYIANCTKGSTLLVAGSYNSGQPIYVNEGWNLIPVLSYCPVDIKILSPDSSLKIAKEVAGLKVYWPEANIFDLTQLEPGKSYLADYNNNETIIFPTCESLKSTTSESLADGPYVPDGWGTLHKTPASFVIALPPDKFAGKGIVDGDVLGGFTPEGILGGVCEIGINNSLVLFGNDPLTAVKDGFNDCDPITLKLFKRTTGAHFSVDATVKGEGSLDCFRENGFIQLGTVVLTDVNSVQKPKFLVYPNPVNHSLNVVNPVESVTCTIYNTTGQVMMCTQLEHGINKLSVQMLRSGIYIIQFKDQNYTSVKRFVKQ